MKKISIIIPLYNNEKYIYECINSIISQSYKNLEIIIVDDGSTDKSCLVCEEIRDDRITLIKQNNFGAPAARNEGLKRSCGEYIMFLDSDDCLYSNKVIEEIITEVEEDNYDLYIGNVQEIKESGEYIRNKIIFNTKISNDIEQTFLCDPVPAGKLYKRSLIEQYNIYFDNLKIGQDLNFYLKYIAVCQNIKKSDKVIASYRILDNSISRTYGLKVLNISESLNKVECFYKENHLYEKYSYLLNIVKFVHLYNQFVKYVYINKKYIRNIVKYYFTNEIINMNINYKLYSIDTVRYLKKLKLKFHLKRSKIYFYKKKIEIIKKGRS